VPRPAAGSPVSRIRGAANGWRSGWPGISRLAEEEGYSTRSSGSRPGGEALYLEKGKKHGPVFEMLVADVQSTKKRLVAAGCRVLEEDPELPRCYLRDPFGMVFNLGRG
jgi:hypothetical protein